MVDRSIVHRTTGTGQGPITRLVSPSGLGELLKPFVFLDLAQIPAGSAGMGWHPHSGIATVTVILDGAVTYEETTGTSGRLDAGGVEFMASGAGVWHTGGPAAGEHVLGFQLWVALPPNREVLPARSQYFDAKDVDVAGPARVILGEYSGVTSAIDSPPGITYLDVCLAAGEHWTYTPPAGHDVAWLAVHDGQLNDSEPVGFGELVVFSEGEDPVTFSTETGAGFVLGSAIKHPYPLHVGSHSVHTSAEALKRGETEISRISDVLRGSQTI